MKAWLWLMVCFSQIPRPPTVKEITEAYRAKCGEYAFVIPGLRWEVWRIREIRGWSLRFKRLSETRTAAILARNYRVVARQEGACAEYRIRETAPMPPMNTQIRPSLAVEEAGVRRCR